MDIYEFAMQMEKDGEAYYRQLLQESPSAGLKKIFALLADEEASHHRLLSQLRHADAAPQAGSSSVLHNVKNIFLEMRESRQNWPADTAKAAEAFKKAVQIEERSRAFYLEKAAAATDEQVKSIFNNLAKEEEHHMHIMENIVEFVSRPEPGNWLENAEWHHLDEY